jgi:hypothetical protein
MLNHLLKLLKMRILLILISIVMLNQNLLAQDSKIIKAADARKYIGKEIIVKGQLCDFGNSSYAQFAWFYLGSDTAHKQLMVLIQGDTYQKDSKVWIGSYIGKEVQIKGIVKGDKEVYLDATDTLMLKH